MTRKAAVRARQDRWADWAVVGTLVVALLLGWAVKLNSQAQREVFTDETTGLTVAYPRDWLVKAEAGLVFQALDPEPGDFRTSFQVRVWPIDASAAVTPTLASVLNDAALSRAQGVTAFRLFDLAEGGGVGGEPSMEATYAYVVESSNPFSQQMPVVVEGLDVAVAREGRAYVFSLLSAQGNVVDERAAFRQFVDLAEIR